MKNQLFVQTNNVAGNQILAYDRAEDGTLTLAETVGTAGTVAGMGELSLILFPRRTHCATTRTTVC